jgi:hypothetical protein
VADACFNYIPKSKEIQQRELGIFAVKRDRPRKSKLSRPDRRGRADLGSRRQAPAKP